MKTVEFIEPFLAHAGAQYNIGERALLDDETARYAVALGCATYVEDAKNLAGPVAHKQMRRAPAAKV